MSERTTNYTLLLHLPNGHSAEEVTTAITHAMAELPKTLRRSLTWDQSSTNCCCADAQSAPLDCG